MLDKFDQSKIDEMLVLLLSFIAFVQWVYKLYDNFFTTSDFSANLQDVRKTMRDVDIQKLQNQFTDSKTLSI